MEKSRDIEFLELRTINGFADYNADVKGFVKWCNHFDNQKQMGIAIRLLAYARKYNTTHALAIAMDKSDCSMDARKLLLENVDTSPEGKVLDFNEKSIRNALNKNNDFIVGVLKIGFHYYSGNDNRFKFYPQMAPQKPARSWWKLW